MSEETSKKAAIPFNYDVDDKSNTNKAPKFNGNGSTFSWWKDRIYTVIWLVLMMNSGT
jgi:hypothetical protein